MNNYFLSFIIITSVLNYAKASEVFATRDTPVWFIESNPRDAESPMLKQIPNAFFNAGLINEENDVKFESTTESKTDEDSLYVEVLVVVDYCLYKKLGENVKDALSYVTSFWNGVALRYKLFTSPKVHICIAGVVLAKDSDALYYVHQNKDHRGNAIANKVIFEGGKYFLYSKKIKSYDIVVTMTTEDLCSMGAGNVCYSSIVGLSLLGKGCHSHLNIAIIEDNGGFSGTIPATHEVAHLLNVPHDGTGDSSSCSAGAGYIMTPFASLTENNFRWSSCSKNVLKKFSLTKDANCLRNKPVLSGLPVKRILPGKLLSLNEQCALAGYGISCANGKRICNALLCFRMDGYYCDADGPSAEGSPCGDNLYCRDGECVPEN